MENKSYKEISEKESEILKSFVKSSSFRMSGYCVDIFLQPLKEFLKSLMTYTDYDHKFSNNQQEFFDHCVPEFQRSNDKWSLDKKVKFLENLFLGAKTEILMYYSDIENAKNEDAMIIDGLQRLTAVIQFLNNEFKIFGKYYFDNLPKKFYSNVRIAIRIYTFKTHFEILKFYVDMNEGITHSQEDIEKAKKFFKENYNITYSNGYDFLDKLIDIED